MSSQAARPGKTGPRLIQDVLQLDDLKLLNNHNVLTDPPPFFDEKSAYPNLVSNEACRHNFATVRDHSTLPTENSAPQKNEKYHLEAICRRCRRHVLVEINFETLERRACPNNDYPLHHFVCDGRGSSGTYFFHCSSPDCRASLQIGYEESAISDDDVELLTNTDALRRRYEAAVARESERTGFKLSSGVNALWTLRRYVRDSMTGHSGKRIPAINKRFLEAFGQDCDELFTRLGFTRSGSSDEPAWLLPSFAPEEEHLNRRKVLLRWWDMELQILMDQLCARDGDLNPCPNYTWYDAREDLGHLLASSKYTKNSSTRLNLQNASAVDHPQYASLGSLRDFSDQLIEFCFDRQADCDPQNTSYYYDCLKGLARGRESDSLQLKATMLESQGVVGHKDVEDAYKYLDVDQQASDSFIVDKYRARLQDTGPSMQAHMKSMLEVIGRARGSATIIDAATDQVNTYEQALSWLGAEASYGDDAILTLYTTKTADNPSSTDTARRAVQMIADTRKSDALSSWLSTGEMRDNGMSVDDACKHLQIKLDEVDEGMLGLVFENARKDNPGQKTNQAIDMVTKAYTQRGASNTRPSGTWPVGLTSHGNTCYLNSLLQYYFTIKALRDIVLHFDQYRFDLEAKHTKDERVGGLKVRPFEIRAYQKFVDDLRYLFERMIKDPGTAVKPEADLVCRAFLKAEDTDVQTKSSAPSDDGKGIDGGGEKPMASESPHMKIQQPTPAHPSVKDDGLSRSASVRSSVTLVESRDEVVPDAMAQSTVFPPSPPQSRPSSRDDMAKSDTLQAPPLPPRTMTTPEIQQTNLSKAEEAARQQQDVTEVMDEILFRLRAAVDARGADAREEQLDAFRDIFYTRLVEKTSSEGQEPKSTEEDAINLLLNIPNEPTDIYSALDELFDLQTIDHGGKKLSQYKSLLTLPPVLQINIPRNTYDRTTGRGVKVEHKMHLEDSLYMDRYCDTNDSDILRRRQQCWQWRKQLRSLQTEKDVLQGTKMDVDGASALEMASDYVKGLDDINKDLFAADISEMELDKSLHLDIGRDVNHHRQRSAAIDSQISALKGQIASQFDGLEKMKYRLHAVFFHRGGYGHGHYWTYIKDFKNDMWRVYNDEKVEEFTKLDDIFNAETWQQGTPTYAVYVKDDVKDQYVEAVCRDVEQPPPSQEPVDEMMQDVQPSSTNGAISAPDYSASQPHENAGEDGWVPIKYDSKDVNW